MLSPCWFYGDRDIIIPPAQGQDAFVLANKPKALFRVKDGAHTDLLDFGFAEASLPWLRGFLSSSCRYWLKPML